ncbi:HlyD family efflux transporter periplasmic adaptor subunit [Calothrix sp. PCC 7507]|uniref:HlyD family efflux transporter periplasmic adaptor subunit n=1 Tax=Calothrix sp. PCC 7507 TaxID=99598 RepID=UPI00029EDB87|nr:HlyD family efflux transporter periplasmic adaptor subunit [Calothrix sp. PCC 7507]AFY32590.1 secretion protein HlyD family protein [Calothrix sp. PCC 7507]
MNSLQNEENYFENRFDDEHLSLVAANEFLPHIGKWINIGGGVLVSTLAIALGLTSILNYNVTVKVPASIRPQGELRVIQPAISGTVQKIAVTENQSVTQGQAIAYIDDSRLQNQKSQLESNIQQSLLQLNPIDAQLGEINAQITAQTNLINRTVIAAQAELDGTQRNYEDTLIKATADMTQASAALTLAKVQRDRLQREKLLTATVEETAAAFNLARTQRDRLQREKLLTATVEEAEAALNLAKVQQDRLQREKLLTTTVEEAEAALNLAKVQQDRLQPIVASGAISRSFFEEKAQVVKSAQAKLEQAKANAKNLLEEKAQAVKSAQAKLEQAKANAKNLLEEKAQAVKSAQAKLEQAKANAKNLQEEKAQALTIAQTNLEKAKTAINPSNATVTMASERIKQEQARGEAILAALNKERETLLQQRLEFQKQLDTTRKQLQQVETDLNQSVVRAPITGTVLQLNLRNPGQVVQPSEAIAQIAPLNAPTVIKAQVPAQSIDKVKIGQKVQMQVSACPYPDFGTLTGTVKTIAPDALPVEANSIKVATYEVTIEPKTTYLGRGDRQCHLKTGMEGRADIISRQETVLQFILRKARLLTDV